MQNLLLQLLQLNLNIGRCRWDRRCGLSRLCRYRCRCNRCGRRCCGCCRWSSKAKAKANLPCTRWIHVCRLLWCIAVNLLMEIAKEISSTSTETNTERSKLIYAGSGNPIYLATIGSDWLVSPGNVLLGSSTNVSTISVTMMAGHNNRTSASRAVLLPFQPASETGEMQNVPTRQLLGA